MRRGLMGWNAEELPVAALEARLARLRAEMDAAGMDAFVVYTNNVRPAAMAWITGFTPYWSDALLLVQQIGAPAFATALSKRVSEWIRTTDPVSEIVNTPKPGEKIGERLRNDPLIRRVGVLEYDMLPAGLAHELETAAPAVEWIDGTAMFAGLRRTIDDTERGLLTRCDAIASAALREADGGKARDAGTLAGLIEQSARLAGAEEAYIAVAPDLDADTRLNRTSQPTPLAERFAVRASVAYKGCWVRGPLRKMVPRREPMRGSPPLRNRSKPENRSRPSLRRKSKSCRARRCKRGWPKAASAAIRFPLSLRHARLEVTRRLTDSFWS